VAERLGGLEIEKEYVRRNLTNPAVLIWHRVPLDRDMKARNVELGLHVTIVSVLTLNRLTIRDHLQRRTSAILYPIHDPQIADVLFGVAPAP
jgi:hypothetical protein